MWVKICGIRDVETALGVAERGADAIGLNFYAGSPRCVESTRAATIVQALPPRVTPVGVFVNHSVEEIREICREVGLETVQLHGDEPVTLVEELAEFRVIRALRLDEDATALGAQSPDSGTPRQPWAWLVDARVEGVYGGTGQTLRWDRLTPENRSDPWPPLILAGGLTPENVGEAIQLVRPWGVDVASGVESALGVKDLTRVAQFVRVARDASCESGARDIR